MRNGTRAGTSGDSSGGGAASQVAGTILVIEDDEDTRETLRYVLEGRGHTVVEATDGEEALVWLAGGLRPCLIILDLMMPVMSGLEFLEALRSDPAHADTPVVLSSAWPDRAAQVARVQGVIAKPFKLAALLDYTRRYCWTRPR